MKLSSALIGASMAVLAMASLSTAPASAANRHVQAINACAAYNEYQPVELVTAVDNGSGYTLVWLSDADGELWMCHAGNNGDIYAYEYVDGDLLEGQGLDIIEVNGSDTDQDIAEKVCEASALVQPARVTASRTDGLPEEDFEVAFSVFLQDGAGDLYLCNASGDGSIWAWASLGDPLELDLS